jgi:hypothetical protein
VKFLEVGKKVLVVLPEGADYSQVGVFLEKSPNKLAGENNAVVNRRTRS